MSSLPECLPPVVKGLRATIKIEGATNDWGPKNMIPPLTRRRYALEGIIPIMGGNTESTHMPGTESLGMKIIGGLRGLLGIHMDIRPSRVVLPGIQRHPVKGAIPSTDLGEMSVVSGVSTKEDSSLR